MSKVIAFKLEIDGVQVAVNNTRDLDQAVRDVNKAYKAADYGSAERQKLAKDLGQLKQLQKEQRAEVRDLSREYEISANKGQNSYRALNAELVNLRREYKELSASERQLFGPDLIQRIQRLDTELKDIDADLGNFQRNVGNYGSAFDGVGGALLDLGGIDLAALATPAGAIAAAGTAAVAATVFIKETTEQVRALRGEIQTLTGSTGEELDGFTQRVQAISDTFEVSTNEVTNAANAVSKQLGLSFEEAIERIETGFVAGLNINGEFIDSLREYPAFFAEAFGPGQAAANAFFEVIQRGNEQGIFNDKAIDAVKEVSLRLRELPQTTRDALNAIGLADDAIAQQIRDEGIGAAISTVSSRLGELERDSPEVGQVIADIFGGAGEDAGVDFLISLKDINEATGELIDQSNEYQQQQQATLRANQSFAAAQVEVANAFGESGASIDNLVTQGQALLLRFLIPSIEFYKQLTSAFSPLIDAFLNLGRQLGIVGPETDAVGVAVAGLTKLVTLFVKPVELAVAGISRLVEGYTFLLSKGQQVVGFFRSLGDEQEKVANTSRNMGRGNRDALAALRELEKQEKKTREETDKLRKSQKQAAVVADQFAKGSIGFLTARLGELRKELQGATPDQERGLLSDIVGVEKAIKEIKDRRQELRAELTRTVEDVPTVDLLAPQNEVVGEVKQTNEAILEERKKLTGQLDREIDASLAKQRQRAAIEVQIEQEKAARIAEISQTLFNGFNSISSSLAERTQGRFDNETIALQERYNAEIEAAEGNAERQQELREELAEGEAAIRQAAFEEQKKYRIAAALSSAAEGVVNILSAPTTIPDPFGSIFKGVRIAALSASTALQIGTIQRQRVAARGTIVDGWIKGQSHNGPNGGVSLLLNGQPVLAERDEFVTGDEYGGVAVINKRSAARHRSLLNAIGSSSFSGKRGLLSAINADGGNGVAFAERGGMFTPSMEGLAAVNRSSSSGGVEISRDSIAAIAEAAGQAVERGSRQGTAQGASDANRRLERENRLKERTG